VRRGEQTIPVPLRTRNLTDALERLVQLYDATGQKDKADEWWKQLEAAAKPPAQP
jgi:hypothetical protein